MGQRGPFSRWGLTLAVVLVAHHALAGQDVCRSGCGGRGANQIFKYSEGTTYKYNYEGKIDITLSSAEGQVTSTEVKAVVLLTQQADCNQVLRLQNVQVLGANGKRFGTIPDIEKPVRINFHDGHVEDSICVVPGDNQNSINIKRAIASLFQVNLKNAHETDVFGVCPTETAHHKEGNILVVQKSRNLNKCAYRENLKQDFLATAFNTNSEIKSSPILNADYTAKLRIKNGIVEQANVVESYLYVPFSVGKNGARAEVVSKIQLTGTSKDNPKTQCSQPRSIIFENPHPIVAPTSNANTILTAVKDVVKTVNVIVGPQTAKEFVTLIKTIRAGKKDDLLAVYSQVKSGIGLGDKVAAQRIYLDAILEAGTGDSIEVAITLLRNNELNEIEKKLVFVGLSLVRHATESSLSAATALLGLRNLPYEAYLGIGNLAGRFCRQHRCENNEEINKLTQKLLQKLGDGKAANRQEENEIIFVLKSLANFHFLSDSILQKITAIAQDKKAPNRLRVAALETYLADPCKDKLRDSALNILQDIQQDSEVRIKAYLAAVQCPNAKVGNAVKNLLNKEPSYQVGGFIVSHIRNVKASANPDKNLAKQFLGFSVPKKFPVDFRKWSYNGEFSYAIDTIGIAASTEANIIYSQDSFLPRSTSLNLTAEVFGHTFNFLEIQTRQENLDKLVEHYFGPKGVLRTGSFEALFKDKEQAGTKAWNHLNEKLKATLRSRRDVSRAEIESIGKAVQIKEHELNKDLDLDLSVKAFGSEVIFANLNIYQKGLTPEAIIDKIVNSFAEGLDRLKHFEETLRSNLLFLDVEFAYPTSIGFPLRLAVEGTSNIQVKAKGGLDVRAFEAGRDCDVKVEIIPSANIEVAGRLTLDALVVENGLKVVSTLYSATGGDITINLFNQRKGVDVKFGLPVQEQKLISATHEIVFHTREQTGKESNLPLKFAQAKDFSICLDQLSPFIGLTFCGEVNGPNLAGKDIPILPFPLAGDAKIDVTIENDDLSQYHFRNLINNDHSSAELVLETIGKNNQKKVSFQVNAEIHPEKYIRAELKSPIKDASAEGRITLNDHEKSISGRFKYDTTEFLVKVGVGISGSPSRAVYRPIIEYKAPGNEQLPLNVQGQIIVEQQGPKVKYIFDNVRIVLPDQKTINLKGNLGNDGHDLFTDLTLTDGQQSGSLNGRLHADPNNIKFNAEVQNTINPSANFHIRGELKRQPHQLDSSLQFVHGADLASKTNIITLTNSIIKKYENPQDFVVGTKNKLTYPLVGIDAKFDVEQTPRSLEYDLNVQYNDVKFGSELEIEINKQHQGDFEVEFELYGLDNRVEFKANRQVQGEQSKISNSVEVNGKKLEVNGVIKHHIKPSNVNVGADLTVVLPTHNTPFKISSGLIYNPNELDAHHKVTSGSTVVIDAFIKTNKIGNANGSIKVNIKDLLVVNGHIKANKGTGSGEVLIDAQSLKKQVKIDSTFQVQPPTIFNVVLNIYPSFNTDKSQKIHISTQNKLTTTNVDSKNQLNILGKNLEFNVKGSKTGDSRASKGNGELEIILPDDKYLLGKFNFDVKNANEAAVGQSQASAEYRQNRNAAGRKISFKTKFNTNPKEGQNDIQYNIAADDSNGNNINADVSWKTTRQGENNGLEIKNKLYGSLIKHPVEANLNVQVSKTQGHYEAVSSCGPTAVIKVLGKYNVGDEGTPCSGNVELQLTTPNKNLKTLSVVASGSVTHPQSPSEFLQVQGSGSIFADDDGSVPDAIIDFKGEGQVRANDKNGEVKGTVNYAKLDPISVSAGYSLSETGKHKKANGNVGVQYGQGKNLRVQATFSNPGDRNYKLEAEINAPTEQYKNTKIVAQSQYSEDLKHVTSSIQINSDGSVWNLDSELLASDIAPLINVKVECPDGRLSQFYIKANKVSDREISGELKILLGITDLNFLLVADIDANVETIEQFYIKSNIHSPNLKLENLLVEIQNKPGKTGRRILVTIKSAGKNVVSGSTSYETHDERGKYIAQGSGSFKIREQTHPVNYKFISNRLSKEVNSEEGIEISFDGRVGPKAIDAEFKVSSKQFRILNSYCEDKKECAHFEFDSKLISNDVNSYNHELEIGVDLRHFGLPNEFGLKSVTKREKYNFDQTVDLHFQSQGNSKYQYRLYAQPEGAGISFTTPKRIIALISTVEIPHNIRQGGKISGEVAFYLDKKNQPNKKTAITGWLSVGDAINGEAKLTHPGLQRPLSASIRTIHTGSLLENGEIAIISDLDVFAQPSQKVTVTYKWINNIKDIKAPSFTELLSVQSSGLGVDILASHDGKGLIDTQALSGEYNANFRYRVGNSNYDNILSAKASRTQFNFLLKVLNVNLLKAVNKLTLNKEEQIVESEVSSYNNNPVISQLEVKNFNTIKYTVGFKNTPRDKLQIHSGLIPGQIADIRADHVTGGGKINLFQATLQLDDANFCKPDYNVNSKEIEKVLNIAKTKFVEFVNGLQTISKEWTNDIRKEVSQLGELSKKAAPNLQPLRDYFTSELQKIRNEILSDKSIKELGDLLKKVFGAVASSVGEIFSRISEIVEKGVQSVQVIFANVIESIEQELIPQLKDLAEKITATIASISKTIIEIVANYLAIISQFIEKYQPEIKQLAATFGELGQDVGRFLNKAYEHIRIILLEQFEIIYNEIKALPIFDELKAQYDELIKTGLPNADGVINGLTEISATIKDIIPPDFIAQQEVVELIDLTVQYFAKKLKREPVDDFAVFDKFIQINISLIKKLLSVVSAPSYDVHRAEVPISLDFLKKLPKLVAIKFSPIAHLLKEDNSEEIISFLLSLLNDPRQWFAPFPLYAMVVQGQHIFTFDGKHLTFPANCKYLLARDAVNGNFTLIGSYSNGFLNAITLADKHDSVTLKKGGQVLLNNAASELPTRKSEIAAYRGYHIITLRSIAGIHVDCTPDLLGCSISLSGFYHGQVKGLLGNGNNEPYDDFTIANGKIVLNEADFGNSYKIGNCPPVTVPQHEHQQENPACTKLFSWESPLRYCYPFVKTENFKLACSHGLAAGVKDTEEFIAKAYVAACARHNIPVHVPNELVKCSNSDKTYNVGDKFSVKVPGKSADIILLVDTVKSNEQVYKELVQPLVQDIGKVLHTKGINDVEFHLITYGGENQWPSHVTVNGKLTFKGKAPNIKFSEAPKKEQIPEGVLSKVKPFLETFESVLYDLNLAFGLNLQSKTYTEGIEYPFRAEAVKSIIAVTSRPCEVGKFYILQRLRTLLYRNNQISLNLITPFHGLNVKDVKKTKDVIGFNSEHVFTVSQAKKKPEGTAELYKELQYEDFCVDFTVKNRGNVFVTDNFSNGKPDVKKQFVHTAVHNIVDQLTKIEEGLDCECKLVNPYNAQNVCHEVYSKERPARKGVAKG